MPKAVRVTTRISLAGKGSIKLLRYRSGQQGFSLLELILVLVLVGFMAGMVTPFVMSTLHRNQIHSEVRKIASSLRLARSQAIAQKVPFRFTANIDDNRYWLSGPSGEEDGGEIGTESDAKPQKLYDVGNNIRIKEFSDDEETVHDGEFFIVFYPQGNTSGGLINLVSKHSEDDETHYVIELDQVTGKAEISEEET